MKDIVQKDDPILRAKAKNVLVNKIASAKIKKSIKDMKEALLSQKDGVAIAAPQIGVSLRMFVVSKIVFIHMAKEGKIRPEIVEDMTFINPEIVKISKDKKKMEEGCLSVRWLYGKVKRASRIKIRARNEKGEVFEMNASGLLAQVFQHETDHLEGVLFIDKAVEVRELTKAEIQDLKK